MESKTVYSRKAEKYARYRWDYSPLAIETIFALTRAGENTCVADIGAGTGMLTRHFSDRVKQVYAIEPDPGMRRIAESELAGCNVCMLVDSTAEDIHLPDHCIDLITVGQAIHWFDPEPARAEFRRILKPGGWLAIISNTMKNDGLGLAMAQLSSPEYGFDTQIRLKRPTWKPMIYFFGNGRFQQITFQFSFIQDFERFFGALVTTAGMPDEDHPRFPHLERAARKVFDQFSQNGRMEMRGVTELYIGQVSGVG